MSEDTKERILNLSLKLFSERGYAGVSMSDIAAKVGITKAALYKHYVGKREILECIISRMEKNDYEYAKEYGMPETPEDIETMPKDVAIADKIGEYAKRMFYYWTKDDFACRFRRLITIEQYADKKTAELYNAYLAVGPYEYMTKIFGAITDSEATASKLSSEFYGTMFLFYAIFDGRTDKNAVIREFNDYTDYFVKKIKAYYFN